MEPEQIDRLDAWLRSLLWEGQLPFPGQSAAQTGFEIHRLKGRLVLRDGGDKVVQGVRELFEIFDTPSASAQDGPSAQTQSADAPQQSKLVLIGRRLGRFDFDQSLRLSLA